MSGADARTPGEDRSPGPEPSGELVVLVDDDGRAIGTAPKAGVHTASTPLHRAFSCYLFGPDGRLLLTRRATTKRTFPGLWTNSVCGHPGPGEGDLPAIARRAQQELGLVVRRLEPVLPRFRYRAEHLGVVENEICPVYRGRVDGDPRPDPAEVADWAWVDWAALPARLAAAPEVFSPWCRLQVDQMQDA